MHYLMMHFKLPHLTTAFVLFHMRQTGMSPVLSGIVKKNCSVHAVKNFLSLLPTLRILENIYKYTSKSLVSNLNDLFQLNSILNYFVLHLRFCIMLLYIPTKDYFKITGTKMHYNYSQSNINQV